MTGLVIGLVLFVCCLIGYLVWVSSEADGTPSEPPPTEAELLQARLDLHRIDRGIDLVLARQEQRREAERTKQAIADALENQP